MELLTYWTAWIRWCKIRRALLTSLFAHFQHFSFFFLCTGLLSWSANQRDFYTLNQTKRYRWGLISVNGVELTPKTKLTVLSDGRLLACSRLHQIWHWIIDIIWPESDNDRLHPGSRKGRHVVCPIRCGRGSPWTYPLRSSAAARLLFSAHTAAGTSQPPEHDLERDATDSFGCWSYMDSDTEVGFTPRVFIRCR